ncbi:MAG: HDOD domain-containing protein [Acidovorax temperans]|uniref:HDOD domain-containing protein n=1 Tax=Acidovorax temperans TaxID=80878 RepID=UPI00391C8DA8
MPHLTEFFDNVQLPTMPDVARDLVATMQDDDIPFEKVRNASARDAALTAMLIRLANSARFGLEEPKSPSDTIASLPEEIKRALQLDSAWLAEHLPPVADFMDVSVR